MATVMAAEKATRFALFFSAEQSSTLYCLTPTIGILYETPQGILCDHKYK